MLYLAILQFALPGLSAVWLAAGRPATPIDLWSRLVASWLLLGGISVAGIWLAVPFMIVVLLALFLTTSIRVVAPAVATAVPGSNAPVDHSLAAPACVSQVNPPHRTCI